MTGSASKFDPRYRTLAYLLGAVVGVGVIVWAETEIWYSVNYLRQRTEAVSSEGFHRSDQFEARIRELDDDLFRYSLDVAPEKTSTIVREAESLGQWLSEARSAAVSSSQGEVLGRMQTLLARYAAHARLVLQPAGLPVSHAAWRGQQKKFLNEILVLARELSATEKSTLSRLMEETHQNMDALYGKLILSSLLLVTMGAALAYLVYRGVIAPLQLRLRLSQRVIERQEKLSSLGILAAGVAHEIRNPLTSIKARLFTQRSLLEKRSEALEDNEFITEEISRLEKIVADFLAFARPSEPRRVRVSGVQLFRELEGLFRPALAKARIQLQEEFLADPQLRADPDQLKQVIINLVQNAAESIAHDGAIILRAGTQRAGPGGSLHAMGFLEIEDNGKWVSPEVQSRLFDPFFTTKASGTGLGLSIAARILEKHGGSLDYRPAPQRGAIFRLVLPLAESEI